MANRSEIMKAAWRKRKRGPGKGTCYFCKKKIFARGVVIKGHKFHKGCGESWGAGLKPAQVGKNPGTNWHVDRSTDLLVQRTAAIKRGDKEEAVKLRAKIGENIRAAEASRRRGMNPAKMHFAYPNSPRTLCGLGDLRTSKGWAPHTNLAGSVTCKRCLRLLKYEGMNPRRKVTERKRAPRDAFRYFGAEELNPRVKCPKCGRIMRRVGVGYYICSGCGEHKSVPTTWFPTTEKNPKFKFGPTGFRPPAKWFAKMAQGTSASYFGRKLKALTASQRAKVGQIVGGIWAKYTDATRFEILRKYEPSAVRALANPDFREHYKTFIELIVSAQTHAGVRGISDATKARQEEENLIKMGAKRPQLEKLYDTVTAYRKKGMKPKEIVSQLTRTSKNPRLTAGRVQMLNCPACNGLNPVSRLNVYLKCSTCGAPLRSVRVRHKH